MSSVHDLVRSIEELERLGIDSRVEGVPYIGIRCPIIILPHYGSDRMSRIVSPKVRLRDAPLSIGLSLDSCGLSVASYGFTVVSK